MKENLWKLKRFVTLCCVLKRSYDIIKTDFVYRKEVPVVNLYTYTMEMVLCEEKYSAY